MAGWQSGYAAACKAVYAGSIPTPASINSVILQNKFSINSYHFADYYAETNKHCLRVTMIKFCYDFNKIITDRAVIK